MNHETILSHNFQGKILSNFKSSFFFKQDILNVMFEERMNMVN